MKAKIGFFQKGGVRGFEFAKPDGIYVRTVTVERLSDKLWGHLNCSKEYRADNGDIIVFDAHFVWFTKQEADKLFEHGDFDSVKWCTNEMPSLPPI